MTLIDCNDVDKLQTTMTPQEMAELQLIKKATMTLGNLLEKRGYHSFEYDGGDLVLHQGKPDFKLVYDTKYRQELLMLTTSYKKLISKFKALKGVIVDIENHKIDYDFEVGVVKQ